MTTTKTRAAYRCSICQSLDHTARNHGKVAQGIEIAAQKPSSASGRHCSYCYQTGHYAVTCSARRADEADKAAHRAQLARQICGFDRFHPAHKFVSVHVQPSEMC